MNVKTAAIYYSVEYIFVRKDDGQHYLSTGHLLIAKLSNDLIYLITLEHMERKFAGVKGRIMGNSAKLKHGNPISTYSAVIEWCHGKKQYGGWPHYRGTVVFVSGKLVLV